MIIQLYARMPEISRGFFFVTLFPSSVVKGVERLRNKQTTEAMQHFNKALDIDPENVEGLVGRGAL